MVLNNKVKKVSELLEQELALNGSLDNSPYIRKLMKERDAAKKAAKTPSKKWIIYKHLRNKVRQKFRDAVLSNCLRLIKENKGDPKRMWQVINKVLDKAAPSTEILSLYVEVKTITKEKDI